MHVGMLARLLVTRAAWRRRDRWSTAELAAHQQRAVAALRRHTYAGSAFYRRHHAGLWEAPLSELPPVTKAELMDHFDAAVTTPGLRLADLQAHLRALTDSGGDPGRPWRGRWWAAATAGTTGRRGVFVWDRAEWATVLASYARATAWAGIAAGLAHPLRMAVVSSRVPTHASAVVGAAVRSPLVPTLRLDATAPIAETVAALNQFSPRLLVGYASALRPLAAEQLAGRLTIAPQSVMSASEVLSAPAAAEMTSAWGSAPVDVYAATETAGIASPCVSGSRHLYEDLVIIEPVDNAGTPVPPGTVGSRLWVTVLFSRTLPLIRYELSDRVTVEGRGCRCGRPFGLLVTVEGRVEDALMLPGTAGEVRVHPNVFHDVLDELSVAGWQVVQEPDRLRVLLAGADAEVPVEDIRTRLRAALDTAGVARVPLFVERVNAIPRTPLGKAPLVRALPPTSG